MNTTILALLTLLSPTLPSSGELPAVSAAAPQVRACDYVVELTPLTGVIYGQNEFSDGWGVGSLVSLRAFRRMSGSHYLGAGFEFTGMTSAVDESHPWDVNTYAFSVIGYRYQLEYGFVDLFPTLFYTHAGETDDRKEQTTWEVGLKGRLGAKLDINRFRLGIAGEAMQSFNHTIFSVNAFIGYRF